MNLPTLIELKLASGMTNPQRVKDLADVQELLKLLALPADFGSQLNPCVRTRYAELRSSAQGPATRYLRLFRVRLPAGTPAPDEITARLREADATLVAMLDVGAWVETHGRADGEILLVTTDPAIAREYDMHEESEFLG